jgi:hypothetical protein
MPALHGWNTSIGIQVRGSSTNMVPHGLRETGAFMPPAHVCHSRCNMQNEEVIGSVFTNPSTSTRWVTYETGLSQSAVYHMLHGEWLYPLHVQVSHELQPGDSRFNLHFQFCSWPIHKIVGEPLSYDAYSGLIGQQSQGVK